MSGRARGRISVALLVLGGLLLPVGLIAGWANATIYDSQTFSERTVDLLNSPSVRRELSTRITEQLVRSGNQQAVNFRPAFELAVDAAIDTDTFRSIFRTAIRRTHEAILASQDAGETGLDLSDSVAIISSTLQLPENAKPGQDAESALGTSFADTTQRLADLRVWQLEELSGGIALAGVVGALFCAVVAVAVAPDRRKAVRRVGVVMLVVGIVVMLLLQVAQAAVGRFVDDPELESALSATVARTTADLFSVGMWTAGYGVVIAGAAAAMGEDARRFTPADAARWGRGWVERRRRTTGGTVVLGATAFVAGLVLLSDPWFWAQAALVALGLWLVYFGVTEVLRLVQAVAIEHAPASKPARARRVAAVGAAVLVVLGVVTVIGLQATRQSARTAEAAGTTLCNGEAALCDLPLNAAVLPASHNSMSSSLYPGWLFAEQISTLGGQLDAGVRTLLIDTHYGIPSASRLPGSNTPVVLTDRAAELQQPVGEDIDPAIAERANSLASQAPPAAGAQRDLYLCHNFCELGAIRFSDALAEVKAFVDTHPDDVIVLMIQDATTPADTADAIVAAGLEDDIWTLREDEPLPTLGDMILAGRTVLVFAEEGGAGAPPWYHKAYERWWQETKYRFTAIDQFDCSPNRGPSDAPLFLINHWITSAPADPSKAAAANAQEVLERRVRQCLDERGELANAIAVDFAEQGDLVATTRALNQDLLDELRSVQRQAQSAASGASTGTTDDAARSTLPTTPRAEGASILAAPTTITSLTGGDPARFCATAPDALSVAASWALASLVTTTSTQGQPDLAYGPAAARALADARSVAPDEIVTRTDLAQARADAAVTELRALGVDDAGIDELADLALAELARPDADAVAVEAVLLDRLAQLAGGRGPVVQRATLFSTANPLPAGVFDFGEVSDDVARESGYDCLTTLGS
jgi:hypothetical protein